MHPPSHFIIGVPSSEPLQIQNAPSFFCTFPFTLVVDAAFDGGFLLARGDFDVTGLESGDGKVVRPTPPDFDLVVRRLAAASAAVLLRELTIVYRTQGYPRLR